MSLRPRTDWTIPEPTARVARAAFPKGTYVMQLRDALGVVYTDERFAPRFAERGRPAESPGQLALVTVLQFAEGLSDRQAADAVRGRIDWKYALGLELTDPGFDHTRLHDFRQRLLGQGAEARLLEALLAECQARGLRKARGRQRTDSTRVLAAVRELNRLELVGETLRAALNALALVVPDWLRAQAPSAWFERYAVRVEAYRLPRTDPARQALADTIGADGHHLLRALTRPDTPAWVWPIPAVETLRQVWVQQYLVEVGETGEADQVRRRQAADLPPAAVRLWSPDDGEARGSTTRSTQWLGYQVHLTETGEAEPPQLITHVETTVATTPDGAVPATIHDALAAAGRRPGAHLLDMGDVDAHLLVTAPTTHGIDIVGRVREDTSWQARAGQGFALPDFRIDWTAQRVVCPQGRASTGWSPSHDQFGNAVIHVQFARADCAGCPVRAQCTQATTGPRALKLRAQAEHEALQAARQRQATPAFRARYAARAGIEGPSSAGVRAHGLRRARYVGLAKTHLQHLATAVALNLLRLVAWFQHRPRARTRRSHFAALAGPALAAPALG